MLKKGGVSVAGPFFDRTFAGGFDITQGMRKALVVRVVDWLICKLSGSCVVPDDDQLLEWLEHRTPITCRTCGRVYTWPYREEK